MSATKNARPLSAGPSTGGWRVVRRLAGALLALAVLPLLAFGPAERTAPTHWALVIGISDYEAFEDEEGGDLPGAEHDARGMRDVLLTRWGFPEANVRTLLNAEATREGILDGFRWLQENSRPGDNVLIFFAGHGAQVWDDDGDEEDGLDETIAPYDVDPSSPDFDIVDDEMAELLAGIPARGNIVYVHDNCNAGTGTRAVTPFSRARKLGRDVESLERPPSAATRAAPGETPEDESGFDLSDMDVQVLELAASQPDQAAVDAYFPGEGGADPFHGGAFSTFVIRELWRAPEDATYEEVFRAVARQLEQNRFEQDPHITEAANLKAAPLFFVEGGTSGAGASFVPVRSVSGGTAELAGGAALGLTTGSLLETDGGATLRITSVERDRADAEVLSGAPEGGARARLVGYRYPEIRLRVGVAGVDRESVQSLRSALPADAPITLVDDADAFSHVFLDRRGTELRLVGQDGFTRSRVDAGAGAGALADSLVMEASAMALGEMDNPGGTFAVDLWMADDKTRFGLGETVSFHATSERDGYLTLVDLGTDGTVIVLFPNPYDRDNRIQAGETLHFPSASMDSEIVAQPPAGRGMVRAFVTPEPLDIPVGEDFLLGSVDLADRIARALEEAAGAAEGAPDAVSLESWGTASLVYEITN